MGSFVEGWTLFAFRSSREDDIASEFVRSIDSSADCLIHSTLIENNRPCY